MKPIKFRGKEESLKEQTVYGIGFIRTTLAYDFLVKEDLKMTAVKRNSVKQLVGYDADGNEVYEGDEFTDKYGHTFTARLQPQGFCKDGHFRFDWMPHSCDFHTLPDDFNVEEDYVNAGV